MSSTDEAELRRLCDLLAAVDRTLPQGAPEREGVPKADLALHLAFINGLRPDIEQQYEEIGAPQSDEQRTRLGKLGMRD